MLRDIIDGFVSLFQPDGPQEDRRKVIRLRCRFDIFLLTDKEVTAATVVDMGLQGLRVECREYFKTGTQVSLIYRGAIGEQPAVSRVHLERDIEGAFSQGVLCEVSWSQKDKFTKVSTIGVTYNDSPKRMGKSWVKKILREIGFDEDTIFQRRKIVRVISSIPCKLTADKSTWRGRVINMGAGGALFQGDYKIQVGQVVKVSIGPYKKKLKNLEVRGQIVTQRYEQSTNGWLHGVRFMGMSKAQVALLGKYVVGLLKEQVHS